MIDIQIKQIEEILSKNGLDVDTVYNPRNQILEFYIKNSELRSRYTLRDSATIKVYEFVNIVFRDFKIYDDDNIDENWEHMPY